MSNFYKSQFFYFLIKVIFFEIWPWKIFLVEKCVILSYLLIKSCKNIFWLIFEKKTQNLIKNILDLFFLKWLIKTVFFLKSSRQTDSPLLNRSTQWFRVSRLRRETYNFSTSLTSMTRKKSTLIKSDVWDLKRTSLRLENNKPWKAKNLMTSR